MADQGSCSCCGTTRLLLACAGGANVGQMTNEVAKLLHAEGEGRMFCLAGVGGHVPGMVASVKGADRVLVLDGCALACARRCMEQAGIEVFEHLVVTELGIEKQMEHELAAADLEMVANAARQKLRTPVCGQTKAFKDDEAQSGCCS